MPQESVFRELPAGVELTDKQSKIRVEDLRVGRLLFFSPLLSRDASTSCGSCHFAAQAFQDSKVRSVGLDGRLLDRNSPSLLNVGWSSYITWSNLAFFELERHMIVPLFGDDPPEMAARFDDIWLQEQLSQDPKLSQALLEHSQLDSMQALRWPFVLSKVADYMRSLTSFDSAWDRYQAGEPSALSADARAGEALFFSSQLQCSSCHPPPFFSTAFSSGAASRAPKTQAFANNGLYFLQDSESGYPREDPGLMEFTGDPADGGRFRIPSLRNVQLSAPYMHDGSIASLDEVLDHYQAGGRFILDGAHRGDGSRHPNKDPRVSGFDLNATQRRQLLAFLESLTGEQARIGYAEQ